MKRKLRLKPYVLPSIYLILVVSIMITVATNYQGTTTPLEDDLTYVSSIIFTNTTPVVATDTKVLKPYNDSKVILNKTYYNYKGEENEQKNSLIYYEGAYIQNSGVDYIADAAFDILSILNGTVIKVEENELLGKTVEVRHENNIISVYQCLNDVKVSEGDYITQGQVIAKSGTSKIYSTKNNLHLELIHNGKIVNPETYYDKLLKDL